MCECGKNKMDEEEFNKAVDDSYLVGLTEGMERVEKNKETAHIMFILPEMIKALSDDICFELKEDAEVTPKCHHYAKIIVDLLASNC